MATVLSGHLIFVATDHVTYHLRLRCFLVIDLKRGPFKAGYAGTMNFYLNVVNDQLRHETDE